MQTCSVEGCVKEAKVRGMCKPHYVRSWKKANVSIESRTGNELYAVWCSKRKDRVSEWDDFEVFKRDVGAAPSGKHRLRRIDRKKPFGPGNMEWRLAYAPKREGESLSEYIPRAMRIHVLRYKYGLTKEQYDEMFSWQNGVCAICKRPETAVMGKKVMELAVDHCHTSGKIRGLLCSTCNTALGSFRDDIQVMESALKYLEHHNGVKTEDDSRPQAQEENEGR